tara:strand:+ start:2851 stop:3048 length:198 start_codon:yes stop_codon:yes gene_type:complete
MKRDKIIAQLESQLATANAAMSDSGFYAHDYSGIDDPAFYDGYWIGARFHLREALTLLYGKELER